ncbi:MAG: hypothetical protein ABEK03_05535, partial [Candidatus Bipolaricaulia bacterium]
VDEEANVAYVAMTRAIERLVVPEDLTKELELDWTEFRGAPASTSRRNGRPPSPPTHFAVDDRVQTRSGPGRIVQVDEDGRYVVALEEQSVKVREQPGELKRIDG